MYLNVVVLTELPLNLAIISLCRINYQDPNKNNVLALNVGYNVGDIWSNIATLAWPLGLAGPPGEMTEGSPRGREGVLRDLPVR